MDGAVGDDHGVAADADAVALDRGDAGGSGGPSRRPGRSRCRCAPVRAATWAHSGPAAEPVAGSSPISAERMNERARAVPASGSTAAR